MLPEKLEMVGVSQKIRDSVCRLKKPLGGLCCLEHRRECVLPEILKKVCVSWKNGEGLYGQKDWRGYASIGT